MSRTRVKGLSFARRMYVPRTIGSTLGFVCVVAALAPQYPQWWGWVLIGLHGLAWPHIAYLLARCSKDAYHTEQRSLVIDGLAGGFWVGAIGLNPLPSVVILSMILMDKMAAGGPLMLVKIVTGQVCGGVLGYWLLTPELFPPTTTAQIYACLPLLLVYPMSVSYISYLLGVQLGEHKRALARLSQTDGLTGLTNHGAWKAILAKEYDRCRAGHGVTTLALIDIDHFKRINDNHGHLVGDSILRVISTLLTRHLGTTELLGRYGGDEFCVLLPGVTAECAAERLEPLRESVALYRDPLLPELQLTLSIGVAAFQPNLSCAEAWLHEADMTLYCAKRAGRNRIALAGSTPASLPTRPLQGPMSAVFQPAEPINRERWCPDCGGVDANCQRCQHTAYSTPAP